MRFSATVVDRSRQGHFYLEDVECENGMRRSHAWVNGTQNFLGPIPPHTRVRIEGKYRRYRPGPDGWTICGIRRVEVIE